MKQLIVQANAKINLTLNILNKRSDGYHNIETIMQSVDLCDIVTVTLTNDKKITVETDNAEIPCNEQNIAVTAAKYFFADNNIINKGVHIKINKKIPITAGLAGGSADAAAVLIALNSLYETTVENGLVPFRNGLSPESSLMRTGLKIGADVPFCLIGSTILAQGIGEQLTHLESIPDCYIVIAKVGQKASTAHAYARFDEQGTAFTADTQGMIKAIKNKNLIEISAKLLNVFEQSEQLDSIEDVKMTMFACGALGTIMSGSGPSVFGIFDEPLKAENCAEKLKLDKKQVFLCHPIGYGCKTL
jgi:4-diphosphocytidyl-2-C-methyl-D-erythritol kinase